MEGMEVLSKLKTEEFQEKFKEIRPFCDTDEKYNDVVLKVALLDVILAQVNEIFIGSLYNPEAVAIIESANASIAGIQSSVVDIYIKNTKDRGELVPIPDIQELATWVEEVHTDIALQLYAEGFVDNVMIPALNTITSGVIDFAKEEAGEAEEEVSPDLPTANPIV